MTDSLYVPPTMPKPPYRVLLMGSLQPAWYTSTNEDRRDSILPAMKALVERWEALSLRLLGSFDDDLFLAGPPQSVSNALYMLVEVESLDAVVQMLQLLRETSSGVRMDSYLRFEARVGRPFFLASDFS